MVSISTSTKLTLLKVIFPLTLKDNDGRSIYDASFTFLKPNKLLIASIQGPSYEEAQEAVKQATKELHGVRPMFMLMNVFPLVSRKMAM